VSAPVRDERCDLFRVDAAQRGEPQERFGGVDRHGVPEERLADPPGDRHDGAPVRVSGVDELPHRAEDEVRRHRRRRRVPQPGLRVHLDVREGLHDALHVLGVGGESAALRPSLLDLGPDVAEHVEEAAVDLDLLRMLSEQLVAADLRHVCPDAEHVGIVGDLHGPRVPDQT
jgi:hypothetical protein